MRVQFPIKYKIFAVVFSIQLVVISGFIISFVKSFKEEKLTSAYEVNASAISELKTRFESKVFLIIEKIKSTTAIVEKNQLKKTNYTDYLNLSNDQSVESFFHYETADNETKLDLLEKFDKGKTPEMNDYFLKIFQANNAKFPYFWNFEYSKKSYTGLAFSLSYDLQNPEGGIKTNKHVFFIFFNKQDLFRLKKGNQLADVLLFTKSGQIIHYDSTLDFEFMQSWLQNSKFKDSLQSPNLIQVSEQLIQNKNYLVSSQMQSYGDLIIATLISTDKAFAGVQGVYKNAFILAAISILFSYLLALYLSSSITKPLRFLTQQMQNVSKGQLDIEVDIRSNDEVGVLAKNFKQMTIDLNISRAEVVETCKELVNLNQDLENKVAERTKQLEELTVKDALTGAFNRRYFDQKMLEEIDRSKRTGSSIGLLYLDIDHFKKYNDQNGHPEGDQLLINFVKTLKALVRTNDYFCRLGGEEFCIITVNSDIEGSKILAEKVCSKIYQTDFKFGEKQPMGRLSCSIGVSLYPQFASDVDGLVKSADEALYHAKQGGRNRWVISDKPVANQKDPKAS